MKEFLLILLLLLTATGCVAPKPESIPDIQQKYKELKTEHTALQSTHEVLLINHKNQKKTIETLEKSLTHYNELLNENRDVKLELEVFKVQYHSQITYYEDMFTALSSGSTRYEGDIGELNKQYQSLLARYNNLNSQLETLKAGEAKAISDNLTTSEQETFYRGLDLWWNTLKR